jgi:hypothetical protein
MGIPQVTIAMPELIQMSTALATVDYAKMYEIAETVAKNPALIGEFDRDPVAVAKKINGFEPPAPFHMHVDDASNVYHPKEDDALSQISGKAAGTAWTRIEARAGFATVRLAEMTSKASPSWTRRGAVYPTARSWMIGFNPSDVTSRLASVIGSLKRRRPALPGFT